MNEALKVQNDHQYLIGKTIGEEEITHVLIVPSSRKDDVEIIQRTYLGKPIDDIIACNEDFSVIVVCDLNYPSSQIIPKYDLDTAKKNIT